MPKTARQHAAAEVLGVLDDGAARGHEPGAGEFASVLVLLCRAWADRACAVGAEAALGAPIALVCFLPLRLVYDNHFAPWDGLAEVPSSGLVRWLRLVVDRSFPVHAVVCVVVAARSVRRLRSSSWSVPVAAVVTTVLMASQADLFVEKSAWWRMQPTNGQSIADPSALVNTVSPWSLAVLAFAYLVPVGVLAVDAALHLAGARVPPAPSVRSLTRRSLGVPGMALIAAGWLVFAGFGPVGAALVAVSRRWSRSVTWLAVFFALAPATLLVLNLLLRD